jgi:hypothetical protein
MVILVIPDMMRELKMEQQRQKPGNEDLYTANESRYQSPEVMPIAGALGLGMPMKPSLLFVWGWGSDI